MNRDKFHKLAQEVETEEFEGMGGLSGGLYEEYAHACYEKATAALRAENAKLWEYLNSIEAMNDEDMGEWSSVDIAYMPLAYVNRAHIRDAISALKPEEQ